MRCIIYRLILPVVLLTFLGVPIILTAQQPRTDFPDAPVINDDGGPALLTGEVEYTNPFFTAGVAQPIIILEDQAGFIDRNRYFTFPMESQTLGQITSDFFTSPFSYSLSLPIEPQGTLRDVSNTGEDNTGVMVFAVAYWTNTWGDPFLEVRDQSGGGWSTAYASTRVSSDPALEREVSGGKLLVYAPDAQQGFPSGFGDDGFLFTADDPIVRLPQGYTVVDLDTDPFTFDRSRHQVVDLIEPEGAALVDYSNLNFTDAFDSMVEKFRAEYAFTDYKGIDWDALHSEFRPRFVEADKNNNETGYLHALREFLWRIPDGHVNLTPLTPFISDFQFDVARGIGLGIRETDDGRVLVTYLLEDGPADQAGIQPGAEIVMLNGLPIDEAISAAEPWSQPFSTAHNLRLEQLRYAVRFNALTETVSISYQNPGDSTPTSTTLPAIGEGQSFNETAPGRDFTGFELPVEYRLLESGHGYASIYSFMDNSLLTIQVWERMIQQMNDAGVPGLVVDMRFNGGGSGFLADQMAAYFLDSDEDYIVIGNRGFYSEELGDFYFDPRGEQRLYLPQDELRYHGQVAVLTGPQCASACERFVYNMSLDNRAAIVGHYPTAGLGGSVNDFRMPLDMTIRFTTGRSVDQDGNIHIEGTGIAPTVRVPVSQETLFSEDDPVLEYGIAYLEGEITIPTDDDNGGVISVGVHESIREVLQLMVSR
jgi:C-terminal processing protease CtpA/Prc